MDPVNFLVRMEVKDNVINILLYAIVDKSLKLIEKRNFH